MLDLKAANDGTFSAVFSKFGILDHDRDIVEASAVPTGIELPVLWSHSFREMPVAMGTVRHEGDAAVIDGRFIDSTAGRDAHATVKATKAVQELSWGFRVLESHMETRDGEDVRIITRTDPLEVSFVLIGSNPETRVLAVKSATSTFASESDAALAAVDGVLARARSLAELRAKDGRKLGDTARAHLADLRAKLGEIDALLKSGPSGPDLESLALETAEINRLALAAGVELPK